MWWWWWWSAVVPLGEIESASVRPEVARAWNALDRGSLTYPLAKEALRALRPNARACVDLMRAMSYQRDFRVEESLASIALDACARRGDMGLARKALDACEFERTALTYCILVKGYGRRGGSSRATRERCVREIEEILEEMRVHRVAPDRIFVNALLDAYVRCGREDLARLALDELLEEKYNRPKPDVKSFNAVLKGIARRGDARRALELVREMESMGIKRSAVTDATLAHALAVAGRPRLADAVFLGTDWGKDAESLNARTAACTAVLKAYRGDPARAFGFVARMKKLGVKRNHFTYSELVVAVAEDPRLVCLAWTLMRRDGVEPSTITYNAAIQALLAGGDDKAGLKLAKEARDNKKMSTHTLNIVLEALLFDYPHEKLALAMFARSQRTNDDPRASAETYSIVLKFYGRRANISKVKETWRALEHSKFSSPDLIATNTYIDALCRCNDFREALRILDEARRPDVVSFSTLVHALSRSSNEFAADRALALYADARRRGIKPDAGLVRSALVACASLRRRKIQAIPAAADPAVAAAKKVLADLPCLTPDHQAEIKAFAKATILAPAAETWKNNPNSAAAHHQQQNTSFFVANKKWNAFDSGFRLL
ncbi:hypothetical protein CTAYLR_007624 [Chrysophaeum taylorii]|uniref:Pentacotripeptide-repeat region of PRORP domain-containing protein n=1 Tax=Chrysophaeum taylorii TaxID=2483200 RepID=A0AAD7XMS1_9STRA|nr:hypothetical protein CTAYLR_007624 [Chrysophaeum taylorii]